MKRCLGLFVLTAIVALAAGGCSVAQTPAGSATVEMRRVDETAAASGRLRIGVLPITDAVPLYIALQEGYFEEEGLAVELVPVASAAERDQLMIAGGIDGQISDMVATALFNAEEPRLRIVRKARQAYPGAPQFRILVPKDSPIVSVDDLRGVQIAVSENTIVQYVTERLLQKEGLDASSISTISVPQIPVRYQLLMEGQVKAATLPEPLGTLAILEGARAILDDSAHPEISQSVLTFRADILEERPGDVRRFLAAYERAIEDTRTRPEEFHNLLVEKGRVPEALADQYTFPPLPGPEVPSREEWEGVVQWALVKRLLKHPVAYEDAVDASFVSGD